MSRWFRSYVGMCRDPKLIGVAAECEQCLDRVVYVWQALMEDACERDDGGRFEVSAKGIAYMIQAKSAEIEAVMGALEAAGMIADRCIVAWSRRQYESDTSTERSRKHRERRRNADATLQDRYATPPDTETDTDTEYTPSPPSEVRPPRQDRASRIDPNWKPTEADAAYAKTEGLTASEVEREAASFRDYWSAKGGADARKVDWAATWRTWVRRAAERRPQVRAGPPGAFTQVDTKSAIERAAARAGVAQ